MASKRKLESIKDYERALRNKYGKGEGSKYKPWLRVPDVSSGGRSAIVNGIKSQRDYQFLSKIETRLFYILEYNQEIIDIREQFPLLPLDMAMQTAKAASISYPYVPGTKCPAVMTTDFLVTFSNGEYMAIAVKPEEKLTNSRISEKLEIERLWWEQLGIKWVLVTEAQAPEVVANNLLWISQPFRKDESLRIKLNDHKEDFLEYMGDFTAGKYELGPLIECIASDFEIEHEIASDLLRWFIWSHVIEVDLTHSILDTGLIHILNVKNRSLSGESDAVAS